MKKKPSLRRILLWVGTIGGGGLFLYQLWQLHQATAHLHLQAPYWLFFALLSGIIAYFVLLLGWRQLLHSMGVSIKLPQIAQGYFISFLPRYLPGSVWGYLGRNEWFKQSHNVAYKDTSMASLLETFWVILTALILILPWWLFHQGLDPRAALLLFAGFLIAITLLLLIARPHVYLGSVISPHLYMLVWCFQGIAAWCSIQAISPSLHPSLFEVMAIISAGWLAGFFAIIIPAGIGVREWAIASLMAHYLHLPPTLAEFAAITFRVIMTFSELTWLIIGLYLYSRTSSKQ